MGKESPTKAKKAQSVDRLSFEEAITQLETIVEKMESDSLPLETLLECHEQGIRLQQACQKKLELARERIQKLEESSEGQWEIEPVAVDESAES
ncbi:MAG: exodeoxyribonuclease VII small subunit [Limisphaerales bacterium]